MDSNALPNILTIGPPESPILTLYNNATDGNGDQIESVSGVFGVDVIGDTLSIDEIDAVVHYGGPLDVGMTVWEVYLGPGDEVYLGPDGESVYAQLLASAPDGSRGTPVDLRALPFGTPVRWTNNGRLIAAFYLKSVDRVGRYLWKITACSGVGVLDKSDHVGGIYTGQTVSAVLSEIIGSAFPYTVAPALADQQVYGWLPYDTARNNLHQLLFALGASMRRDANGEAQFVFLSAAAPQPVDDSRVTFGGSVLYETPATRAEITEHAFFETAGDEVVTLYDNTGAGSTPASNTPVRFDSPMHDLSVTGTLTIDSSGVNYAYVSGVGTLAGKAYTHTMRIVAQDAEGATGEPNVKHVDDYTLVSLANSLNVSKRVLSYYQAARTVSAALTLNGERCGDILSLADPYFDPITAFLESISVNASTTLWGPAKLVENYTPGNQGNNVTGSRSLQGSGTWTSPVTGILQYVLISGGQGGSAGNPGEAAPMPAISSYSSDWTRAYYLHPSRAKGGKGGLPGTPGAGGRVLTGSMSVTEGQQISFACGVGGAGEVYGSGVGHGSDGTDTTFGALSTAGASALPSGFYDPITGERYGAPGESGIAGEDGVGFVADENGNYVLKIPPDINVNGTTYHAGSNGADFFTSGTLGGSNLEPPTSRWACNIPGGFGGGPAFGANGNNGRQGYGEEISKTVARATAGPGGIGATAANPPKATIPGNGGTSGNGGGGNGANGTGFKDGNTEYLETTCWIENYRWINDHVGTFGTIELIPQQTVEVGAGSDGGVGADGIILLYWGGN